MKDGTVTHCYGQYWDGRYADAEKILGIKFADFTHSTIDSLRKCYVFTSGIADKAKFQEMIDKFQASVPDYKPWEYQKYESYVKARC